MTHFLPWRGPQQVVVPKIGDAKKKKRGTSNLERLACPMRTDFSKLQGIFVMEIPGCQYYVCAPESSPCCGFVEPHPRSKLPMEREGSRSLGTGQARKSRGLDWLCRSAAPCPRPSPEEPKACTTTQGLAKEEPTGAMFSGCLLTSKDTPSSSKLSCSRIKYLF